MKKSIFTLLLAMLVSMAAKADVLASGTCGTNVTWSLSDDYVLTIEGTGAMTNYTTSSTAPWYTNYRTNITSVVIKDGVTSIGNRAFKNCSALSSITLPDCVTTIGTYTFDGCTSLTSLSLPDCVTSIGTGAFYGCTSLTSLSLPAGVTSIGSSAFYGCTSLSNLTIPAGVTTIGTCTFCGCTSLSSVSLPEGITSIGESAFKNCSSLSSLTIPAGVTTIGISAFSGCTSLLSITIPNGVTSINKNVFYNCKSLTSVTIPTGVTTIGLGAFSNCLSLSDITIPAGVTSIGSEAFLACTALTNIAIPKNVTSIEQYTFKSCNALKSITIPEGLTSIGDYAFQYCSALTNVTIPEGVTLINEYTFNGCTSLKNVIIPKSVEGIGSYAFSECSSLTSVTLQEGLKAILSYAFGDCQSITDIIVPNSVIGIDENAFYNCTGLVSITLPFVGSSATAETSSNKTLFGYIFGGTATGMECISQETGSSTFDNYIPSSLKNVTITGGNILYGAFSNCTMLTNVKLKDAELISSCVFEGCTSLTGVEVSNSSKIPSYTFNKCTSLTNIVLTNIQSIGNVSFDCDKLTEITLPETVTSIGYNAFNMSQNLQKITLLGTTPPTLESAQAINNIYTLIVDKDALDTYLADANWAAHQSQFICAGSKTDYDVTVTANSDKSILHMTIGEENLQNVVKLKISGTINSYDLMIMRNKMVNLKELDLSDASIVENSYEYFNNNNVGYHSIDNTLTRYALQPNLFTVKLPKTLTTINDRSLQELKYVTNLEIPANVTSLGEAAAKNLSALKTLKFEEGSKLETIGDSAFYACSSISELSIPGTVKSMYSKDIYSCTSLVKFTLEDGPESITINAYKNDVPLQEVYIGRTITTQYSRCDFTDNSSYYYDLYSPFSCKSTLKKVTFGKYVESIPSYCFYKSNCDTIIVPPTLNTIKTDAFYNNCAKNIYINDINAWANIKGLSTLMSTSYTKNIYLNGTKITDLDLTGVTTMQPYAFEHTTITGVTINKDELLDIPDYAFACTKLTSLKLPSTISTIGDYAFYLCTGIKELRLPSDLMTIGNHAFDGCSALYDVYAYSVIPRKIDEYTFSTYKNATLHLAKCNYYDYYYDTQWSQFLKLVMDITEPYESIYVDDDKILDDNTGGLDGTPDTDITDAGGLEVDGKVEQGLDDVHIHFNGKDKKHQGGSLFGNHIHAKKIYFDLDVSAGTWYYFCFPFDIKLSSIQKDGGYVFRYYDGDARAKGNNGWTNIPSTAEKLTAGTGYIFCTNTEGTLSLCVAEATDGAGIDIDASDVVTALSKYETTVADNKSWNFVGNKNLSYYNLSDLKYDAPVVIWDVDNKQYEALRPGDDDYTLYPFQGFFVQRPDNVESVGFEGSKRETYRQSLNASSNSAKRRAKSAKINSNASRQLINLTFSDGESTDKTRVVINEKQRLTFEAECDASKFAVTAGKPQIYSLDADGVKYSINERPLFDGKVKLAFQAPAKGDYILGTTRMDIKAFLQDDETGVLYDLSQGDYSFTSEEGTFDKRFTLVIADNEATAIERLEATSGAASNGQNAYDMSGRRVNGSQKGFVIKSGKKIYNK